MCGRGSLGLLTVLLLRGPWRLSCVAAGCWCSAPAGLVSGVPCFALEANGISFCSNQSKLGEAGTRWSRHESAPGSRLASYIRTQVNVYLQGILYTVQLLL